MPDSDRTQSLDPLEDVDLDPYNPRLRREEEGSSPARLMEIMVTRFKIDELAESILSAGYLPFDPLIAYMRNGRVTILEGNRRLAVIKLLLAPDLAPARYRAKWNSLSARLDEGKREQIQRINVLVYPDREDPSLRSYIGFRHVTGVLQWPALEKAEFIADLVTGGMTYEEIGERLGSYPAHVRRHYVAYRVVRQAREFSLNGYRQMEDAFGVLLRALQSPDISGFLGIVYTDNPAAALYPVPEERTQEFEEFVKWTFGTDEANRLLPDSRRITDWGKILQSPEAIRYLRSSPDANFDRAWIKAGGQQESVADALWTASYRLEETVPLVVEYRTSEDVRAATRNCALFLAQILGHFPEIRDEFGIGLRSA